VAKRTRRRYPEVMKTILTVLLLAIALPLAAQKDQPIEPKEPAQPHDFKGNAIMCNGTYALCIKAQCEPKVSGSNEVRCKCAVIDGWSMGPNSCMDRTNNLTSTYSNLFNVKSKTVSCPSTSQQWAWCYGASCEKDPKDPTGKTAICRCPVATQPALILVSDDQCSNASTYCSQMWSAASPGESKFANDYYFFWMMKNGHLSPKPSEACTTQ
jgi:hypothetical protein